jgi:hypothetical protein
MKINKNKTRWKYFSTGFVFTNQIHEIKVSCQL